MSILLDLEDEQGLLPEGAAELMQCVADACAACEAPAVPLVAHVQLTDDEGIRALNAAYRGVDRSTDVLSFPTVPYPKGKTARDCKTLLEQEWDVECGRCFIGDLIISLPRAAEQAREYGHSLAREVGYLTAHALFHLMGYDHMEETDKRRMRTMEEKALAKAGVSRMTDEGLLQAARDALKFSYSPYSKYAVGAALLCPDGTVYTGCNIENASYGVTMCAERTALFKAVSEGHHDFEAIAIASEKNAPWPCGACRQALYEFAPQLRVLVTWPDHVEKTTLDKLLPCGFGPKGQATEFLG